MTRPIADAELEQLLGWLARAEPSIALLDPDPAPPAAFRRVGPWLVEERFLLGLIRGIALGRPPAAPPRLAEVGPGRLLRALALPPRWHARSRAQAVFVKEHLRAFYLRPEPFSVKLVWPTARAGLVRDVEGRAGAARTASPRVLAHRLDGPEPHLCEELIFGRHPDPVRDVDAIVAFVLGDLWEGYRESGFEWRRAGDFYDVHALVKSCEEMLARAPWSPDWMPRAALLERLLLLEREVDEILPCCLGHGDLSVGNMLISGRRIVLVDWERARRLPLLQELAKITVGCPGAWDAIAARIERDLSAGGPAGQVPVVSQAMLASLARLSELRDRFSATSPEALTSGVEARRFERRMAAELAHVLGLLAQSTP